MQAALSARLDGEPSPLADDVVDAHVEGCAQCRVFLEQAASLNRQLVFSEATASDIPDLADAIIAGVEPMRRRQAATRVVSVTLCRVVLVILGVGWCAWAVSLLRYSQGAVDDPVFEQLLVEAAAMRCALAFGVVFVAWQIRLVVGLLPVYGALFMFSLGFGVRDLLLGVMTGAAAGQLGLLFASVVALGWLWLAQKGWMLVRSRVRSLGAHPVA